MEQAIHSLQATFQQFGCFLEAISSKIRQDMILELAMIYPKGKRIKDFKNKKCLARPTMSHHLKLLCKAGIISYYSEGTKNFYYLTLDTDLFNTLIQLLEQLKQFKGEEYDSSCEAFYNNNKA